MKTNKKILIPEDWGLNCNSSGELFLNDFRLTDLAEEFRTPLYILNEEKLIRNAREFMLKADFIFDGNFSVFYPFKCNSVPGIINAVKHAGLSAEVMTEYELQLALKLAFSPYNIIVNGPCKTDEFLFKCINSNVRFIIVDSLSELKSLDMLSNSLGKEIKLLLRINPGLIPSGLNKESATGCRKSSFGMNEHEILEAFLLILQNPLLTFYGLHFHLGTGIREPQAYSDAIKKIYPLFSKIESIGFKIRILDIGGGFASMTTRELSSFEMLASQVLNRYQLKFGNQIFYTTGDFLSEIRNSVRNYFGRNTPEIFLEPGRCLVSPNMILLLKVHRVKERNRKKWLITDAGLGTITMPTYYEYHEIFLCNDCKGPLKEKVTITGPCCFASDIVYKNKMMPEIRGGEVLALMDTGAYFNALESSFNFPKPAIVSVKNGSIRLLRRKETFNDMFLRDDMEEIEQKNLQNIKLDKEIGNEIHSY